MISVAPLPGIVFRFLLANGTAMALLKSELTPETPPAPGGRIGLPDFYLLLLRVVLVFPLAYYQLVEQAQRAWAFVWHEEEWPLLNAIAELGLPQPPVVSATLIFLLLAATLGIALGFLTRINAAITLLALLFFFITGLPFSEWLTAQTYVLFLGVAAVLVLSGPGKFSLDGIFAAIRRRRKALRAKAAL